MVSANMSAMLMICTLGQSFIIRYAVGEYQFGHFRFGNTRRGGVRHHGVAGNGSYRESALAHHQVGGFGYGTGGIYHIVDENYVLVFDIANDGHALHFVGFGSRFVAQYQRYTEVFGVGIGPF